MICSKGAVIIVVEIINDNTAPPLLWRGGWGDGANSPLAIHGEGVPAKRAGERSGVSILDIGPIL